MAVNISGMTGGSYFANSPVIIEVTGLLWPQDSPFTVVNVDVKYTENGKTTVCNFHVDTGGQTEIEFDISSALRTFWSSYDFSNEVGHADSPTDSNSEAKTRSPKSYSLEVSTEYINTDGVFEKTTVGTFNGGTAVLGGVTERERSLAGSDFNVSALVGTNTRNGNASTKPKSPVERVGKDSITSWVNITNGGVLSYHFYPASETPKDDRAGDHAPLVVRDSQPYTDFIVVNRRGAVETCSALMMEGMNIEVDTKTYSRIGRPAFRPSRSIMTQLEDGPRRSWSMSSGHVSREWAEWWATEFLTARRVWMLWKGPGMNTAKFVPVTITPAKKSTSIYDRAKQQMPHVDFTATLALEG